MTIDRFELTEHLHIITTSNNNSSWFYTVWNSLWYALSLLSLLFSPVSSASVFTFTTNFVLFGMPSVGPTQLPETITTTITAVITAVPCYTVSARTAWRRPLPTVLLLLQVWLLLQLPSNVHCLQSHYSVVACNSCLATGVYVAILLLFSYNPHTI